jgi:arginyl-tRNA synthetase
MHAKDYSPAIICQYCLDLARAYNRLYNEVSILRETDETLKNYAFEVGSSHCRNLKVWIEFIGN